VIRENNWDGFGTPDMEVERRLVDDLFNVSMQLNAWWVQVQTGFLPRANANALRIMAERMHSIRRTVENRRGRPP
jgi:hypothetical protein